MMNSNRVVAVTLARKGSKRVPHKNTRLLCGIPLLQYTINVVLDSKYIDTYIVSSDDDAVREIVAQNQASFCTKNRLLIFHARSPKNASDVATSASAIGEALDECGIVDHTYLIEVMCTNPLKTSRDVDTALDRLCSSDTESVVSVTRVWDHHPSRLKYIEDDELRDFYPEVAESRRQDLEPAAYVRNGSIYATSVDAFRRTGCRLSGVTRPYVMPEERSINIDEERDFMLAELIMKEGKS